MRIGMCSSPSARSWPTPTRTTFATTWATRTRSGMGITERVERMVVRVSSPSGSVSAQIHGRNDVQIFFALGYYQRAEEHDLESQLTQVARLLWAARMREYNAIITDE